MSALSQPRITEEEQVIVNRYGLFMDEVKARLEAIQWTVFDRTGLHPVSAREFCFLQLRLICEVISLGCLVAHSGAHISKKLRRLYVADGIVNALEKLHPGFYPQPVFYFSGDDPSVAGLQPGQMFYAPRSDREILTKAELLRLYRYCGGVLHRGTLDRAMIDKPDKWADFDDVVVWWNKIVALLDQHTIHLLESNHLVIGLLSDKMRDGFSKAYFSYNERK